MSDVLAPTARAGAVSPETAAASSEVVAASSEVVAASPEDAARARWYALFAALFRAPPAQAWLDEIGASVPRAADDAGESVLARAWSGFARACAQAEAGDVRQEYDDVFIGVGKTEVLPYASYYLSGFLNERPLVELRGHLAVLGLARRADIGETEDHIAALCEVMAWLIAGEGSAHGGLVAQRVFFERFLAPWYEAFAGALEASGSARFYRHAGRLLREFLAVERQAFDIDSLE